MNLNNNLCLTWAARVPPDLDQIRRRTNKEQRENWCVNHLIQAKKELRQRYTKRNHALARSRPHRRLRISDHEKHEQLIHRSGNGRDLSLPGVSRNPTAQKRKQKE